MTGQGLLAQIANDVVDDSVPLTSLLRKCVMLAARSGSNDLRVWATKELEGYVGSPELPQYRKVTAAMELFITNKAGYGGLLQRLHSSDLPSEIFGDVDIEIATMSQGVGELEAFVASGQERHQISPHWSQVVVDYLNQFRTDESSRVVAAYWVIYPTSIKSVLAKIRDTLVAFVAELVTQTPADQAVPDKATTDRAVHVVIHGDNNSVNLQHSGEGGTNTAVTASGTSVASGPQTVHGDNASVLGGQSVHGDGNTVTGRDSTMAKAPERDGWWTATRRRGVAITIATLIAAFAAVVTWLEWTPWKP